METNQHVDKDIK